MKPNLELDLMKSDYIANKCISSDAYSQNLYAALCNNRFFKGALDDGGISYEQEWTCSWRHAGAIVAEIVGEGDYMTYYCNGNESFVTEEIRKDLGELGWTIKPYEPKLRPGTYQNSW
jgi:hypothetical protein